MTRTIWIVGPLLGAVATALATLLARRLLRRAPARLRAADDASNASTAPRTRNIMTTSDGTRILLRDGRLVVPDASEGSHSGDPPRG